MQKPSCRSPPLPGEFFPLPLEKGVIPSPTRPSPSPPLTLSSAASLALYFGHAFCGGIAFRVLGGICLPSFGSRFLLAELRGELRRLLHAELCRGVLQAELWEQVEHAELWGEIQGRRLLAELWRWVLHAELGGKLQAQVLLTGPWRWVLLRRILSLLGGGPPPLWQKARINIMRGNVFFGSS